MKATFRKVDRVIKSLGLLLLLMHGLVAGNRAFGANYYWVGGSGNWSDLTHWATTSGGSLHPSVVPGPADNVYFDANSGFTAGSKTVTLNTTANCANMDWTGATSSPIFALSSYDLNIYGSLTLVAGMSITSGCCTYKINFLGSGTHTIQTAGVSLGDRHLVFNGTGSFMLQSAIALNGSFEFSNGTLSTNNFAITCSQFITSSNSNIRSLSLGSSQITVTSNGTQAVFFQSGANFTFDAGSSHFILPTANADFICNQAGFTFYDLSFTANSSSESRATISSNTFHNVVFNGTAYLTGGGTFSSLTCNNSYNTSIYSNNTFGNLNIYGSNKIITFEAGRTQTVNTDLQLNDGSCAFPNTLKSSTTAACTLNVASGAEALNFFKINYVHFQGGPFTANNTMEDIGNTGAVTIHLKGGSSVDYYWVGGSGNWGDPTHWSLSSGGAGQAADGCLPTSLDNVYFDANSGLSAGSKTVTLNTTASCANMDWTGATSSPIFALSSYHLNIYGSLTFISGMSITSGCCIYNINFLGSGTHTVNTAGVYLAGRNVNFNGTGTYTLASDITVERTFYFSNGTLNTDSYDISCIQFVTSSNSNIRSLSLGNSRITVSSNGEQAVYFQGGANFTLDAGTSHFILPTANAGFICNQAGFTFYDLSFTANSNLICKAELSSNYFHNVLFNGKARLVGGGTFNKVAFYHDATIENDNEADSLIFNDPGFACTYVLERTKTQTINEYFEIEASGCFPAILKSSTSGSAATISYRAGKSFDGDFLILSDISATGGATFNAGGNSEDEGGNSGWTWGGPTWTTSLGVYYECKAEMWPHILRPVNHEFARSYTWSTGETADHITVTAFGTYWCTSSYGLNCIQTDTFHVGASSYAGAVTTYFAQIVDSLWQKCQNWTNLDLPDSTTSVVVENGKTLYVGDDVTAYCRNITIDAGGRLHVAGGRLYVYGDFVNNGTFTHSADSVLLAGSAPGGISGSGAIEFHKLYLQKNSASDSIGITCDVNIAHTLHFSGGVAYVDNAHHILFLEGSGSEGSGSGSFIDGKVRKTGSTDFTFPVGNRQKWARLGISGLTGVSTFEAQYQKAAYPDTSAVDPLHHPSFIEHWLLERIAGASGAMVTLYWEDKAFSAIQSAAPSDLCVAHYNGSDWEDYGHDAAAQSGSTGWVRSPYQTDFSPLTFGALSTSNPLPVELTEFSATATPDGKVELSWTTHSELNNDFFSVERSKNGANFETIGTVKGNGTSSRIHHYGLTDDHPHPGLSYYRLRQTDFDGTHQHFNPVAVEVLHGGMPVNIYPNPATSYLHLEGWFEGETRVSSRLYNTMGVTLRQSDGKHYGPYRHSFDVSAFPSGVYCVEINVNGRLYTGKVLIGNP